MPLTPAIRPLSAISITAETPISAPPTREAIGVKAVMGIAQGFLSLEVSNILIYGHGTQAPGTARLGARNRKRRLRDPDGRCAVNITARIEPMKQRYFPIFPLAFVR